MGTVLMIRNKIGNKVFLSYIILLLATFLVSTLFFHFLSQRYLIAEAREQMRDEISLLADSLERVPLGTTVIEQYVLDRQRLHLAGRLIESTLIIRATDGRVFYSNVDSGRIMEVESLLAQKGEVPGYVAESIPLVDELGLQQGEIIMLTRVKDITGLNSIMRRTMLTSLLMAGLLAMLLALYFQRTLTSPIRRLIQAMQSFSVLRPLPELNVCTGDEIEELADCFQEMASNLQAYDESQRIFLQNTSHELKTPLTSIQGYAEAIKDGVVEGPEVEESLDIIISESQRLKRIVEEIIYLTRLENVEDQFRLEEGDLLPVLQQVLRTLKPLAGERGVNLKMQNEVEIRGAFDAEKMERAFINVIGNCVRFARSMVAVGIVNKGSGYLIEVIDDGPGFKPGEEKHVFDRFYRGDPGGTGLGLAISQVIIAGHQGNITATNRPEGGALFQIFLP